MDSNNNRHNSNRLWPQGKQVAFTVRDDDVSYFTEPWMLETVYKEAWKMGFGVSLAVVPYIKATVQRQIPKKYQGSDKVFSLTKNRELVAYLKERLKEGCIDIVQHGLTHTLYEFGGNNFELLNQKLKKGRQLLNNAFKTHVDVFVAPHGRVSRAAWRALIKNNMNLCQRFSLLRLFLTTFPDGMEIEKFAALAFRSPNPFKPVSEDVINISKILVVQPGIATDVRHNIDVEMADAKKALAKRLHKGGAFVVVNHYWEFFDGESLLKDRLASFNELLNHVHSGKTFWKTTLSEICHVYT